MAHYIYPAVFIPDETSGFTVVFPDLKGCVTEGDTLVEAIEMGAEALALHLYGMEVDGDEIPLPSAVKNVVFPEEATADSFVSLVSTMTEPIYDKMANRAVKKTLTIPNWLNVLAEKKQINFSRVLQVALMKELNVIEKEARVRYGDAEVDASNAKVAAMSREQWQGQEELAQEITRLLKVAMKTGDPGSIEAQQACELHKKWICLFWKEGTYSPEAHRGLAEMYVHDDRFKAYYEDNVGNGAATFLRDAINIFTKK